VLIGKVREHIDIDRIVAKRLRVLLQTDPAEPTVDVQVQSPGLLSAGVSEKGCTMGDDLPLVRRLARRRVL
jgi:hypothetical protein